MRYKANNRYNTTLIAPFDGSEDVVMKVKALPDYLPTLITLNYSTSTESTYEVTGSTGTDTLTGLTLKKGEAQNYYEGTPVDCLNWADFYNQYADVSTFFFADDDTDYGSFDNQYHLGISDDTFDLVKGTMLAFQPIQTNTGAVTIKINNLDPVALTKNGGEALIAGDMIADQIMTLMYSGTELQLMSVSAEDATTTSKGIVRPDNSTTFVTSGVISTLPADYETLTFTAGDATCDVSGGRWFAGVIATATPTITIDNLDMGICMLHLENDIAAGVTSITFTDGTNTITPAGFLDLADNAINDIAFQYTPDGIVANVRNTA